MLTKCGCLEKHPQTDIAIVSCQLPSSGSKQDRGGRWGGGGTTMGKWVRTVEHFWLRPPLLLLTLLYKETNIVIYVNVNFYQLNFPLGAIKRYRIVLYCIVRKIVRANWPSSPDRRRSDCACARGRGSLRPRRSEPPSQGRHRAETGDSGGHHRSWGQGWSRASRAFGTHMSYTRWTDCPPAKNTHQGSAHCSTEMSN